MLQLLIYIDKILTILSAASGAVSITSFTSVVGAPVEIASAGFTILFALTTAIIKKLWKTTRNKKKKHDIILMLAKGKLNSIESLISQALIDMDISHEEFITILREKDKYDKMKENVWTISKKLKKEKTKNIWLNSVKSKI